MKTLCIRYEENGEAWEIWETEETDLEMAWKEIDEKPTEGGQVFFEGSKEFITVNGGFR